MYPKSKQARRVPKQKAEKKPKQKRTKSTRKQLEAQLEALIRQIVWWRDGGRCIEADIDGVRCGGGIQWGHFTPRRQSAWLKFTLATFCQCRNHNGLHDKGSQTMGLAVDMLLGTEWHRQHEIERDAHRNAKITTSDLQDRLKFYQELWDNRPSVFAPEMLKELGYYASA